MKNETDIFDAFEQDKSIYIGKLRYCYKLSVDDAEEVLNEIGGVYSSVTHEIHRGEEYSREKTRQVINGLTPNELSLGSLIAAPGSLINEASELSRDGNYNPVTITAAMHGASDPRLFVYWAIIDTCTAPLCSAVLYIEEELGRRLVNELPELPHKFCKQLIKASSRRGAVPGYICEQYERFIAQLGEETSEGRRVRVYMRCMQGVMANKEIADELKFSSAANITRYSREGAAIAAKHGLPLLEKYESDSRRLKRGPKKKKKVVSS